MTDAANTHREPPRQDLPGLPSSRERTWATFCHLAAFTVLFGIPLGLIAGPLVVWLIKKNESTFVDRHGKTAVNFQLSMVVYGIVLIVVGRLMMHRLATIEAGRPLLDHVSVLWFWTFRLPLGLGTAYVLFPFLVGLVLLDVVCTIIAAVWANAGRPFRYPYTIPFIR
ncbi:MAG: DUF4870 domain-containing protein [Verrucomicrobia bacterium]|nr:DUF4870 domain-containing protein [Verrucomicrobiota bacterium]